MQNMSKETKQYTLLTQILNGLVAIAAVGICVAIAMVPSRLTDPNWVIWLLVVVGGFHTFEEYIWPGGFLHWINGDFFNMEDFDKPLSAKFSFYTDASAGFVIIGLLALLGTNLLVITLAIASVFMINGAWHLMTSVTQGTYSPGAVSSAVLNLPVCAYILHFYYSIGMVGWIEIVTAYGFAVALHIVFFAILRNRKNDD